MSRIRPSPVRLALTIAATVALIGTIMPATAGSARETTHDGGLVTSPTDPLPSAPSLDDARELAAGSIPDGLEAPATLLDLAGAADSWDDVLALVTRATEEQAGLQLPDPILDPIGGSLPAQTLSAQDHLEALAHELDVALPADATARFDALDDLPAELREAITEVTATFIRFVRAADAGDLSTLYAARNDLVRAVGRFRSAATSSPPFSPIVVAPVFALGGPGADLFTHDVALSLDVGGDDTYRNNAGGNGVLVVPGVTHECVSSMTLPAAALVDVAGDDRYVGERNCGSNGGGFFGAGFLADLEGDDVYRAGSAGVNGGGNHGAGFLLDASGDDVYGSPSEESTGPLAVDDVQPDTGEAPSPFTKRYVVGFHDLPPAMARGTSFAGLEVEWVEPALRFAVVAGEGAELETIREHPRVRYVELEIRGRHLAFTPSDPRYPDQYSPGEIRLPEAWDISTGNSSRPVCVVDGGVRETHEDLGNVEANIILDPLGDHTHGTHVAGIVGATIDNGVGIAGAANVPIISVQALNTTAQVAGAIVACVGAGARVINMSLGFPVDGTVLRDAVEFATAADILVVAAAGNEGPCADCVLFPARYPGVLAVANTGPGGSLSSSSSRGSEVEVGAPGNAILSTLNGDNAYGKLGGTSMASPLVAGSASLVWGTAPHLRACQVRQVLRETATDHGAPGWDRHYGFGIIDVRAAMDRAASAPGPQCAQSWFGGASGRGANGGAEAGSGVLIDGAGDDRYTGGSAGVNGGARGDGVVWVFPDAEPGPSASLLVDGAGSDRYTAEVDGVNGGGSSTLGAASSGALLDASGHDEYVGGGSGANGGGYAWDASARGLLMDGGGDDRFVAHDPGHGIHRPLTRSTIGWGGSNGGGVDIQDGLVPQCQLLGCWPYWLSGSSGTLVDFGGDDVYDAVGPHALNGGAWGGGQGFLFDAAGRDTYRAEGSGANGGAGDTGAGLLYDGDGDDRYQASGRSINGGGSETIVPSAAVLFDRHGNDEYVDNGGPTQNDCSSVPKGLAGAQVDHGGSTC